MKSRRSMHPLENASVNGANSMACSNRAEGLKPLSANQLCVTVNLVANVCLRHRQTHPETVPLNEPARSFSYPTCRSVTGPADLHWRKRFGAHPVTLSSDRANNGDGKSSRVAISRPWGGTKDLQRQDIEIRKLHSTNSASGGSAPRHGHHDYRQRHGPAGR